jgi:hypothetical protein
MSINLIGAYSNGNYNVKIFSDGTKIRETKDPNATEFVAEFPENIDIKLTNQCDRQCAYCHENSTPEGKHGDILNLPCIDTLRPYTEVAAGGGDLFSHPDLYEFLVKLRDKKVIANITVNQHHFFENLLRISQFNEAKLIYGIGVSLTDPSDAFIEEIQGFPNAVIHLINGIVTLEQLEKLAHKGLKVLFLGYKQFRRGRTYFGREVIDQQKMLEEKLPTIYKEGWFKVLSFDNLAINQLQVQRVLLERVWDTFYMGDDGQHTFYMDLVDQKFAINSSTNRRWDLWDDVTDMFKHVRKHGKGRAGLYTSKVRNEE